MHQKGFVGGPRCRGKETETTALHPTTPCHLLETAAGLTSPPFLFVLCGNPDLTRAEKAIRTMVSPVCYSTEGGRYSRLGPRFPGPFTDRQRYHLSPEEARPSNMKPVGERESEAESTPPRKRIALAVRIPHYCPAPEGMGHGLIPSPPQFPEHPP